MKLAFILFHWFPYGGLQRDLLKILAACRARGAFVTVYCMTWRGAVPPGIEICELDAPGLTRTAKRKRFVARVASETAAGFDRVVGFNRMPGLDFYFAADSCFALKARRERSALYRLTPRCRQYMTFEQAVFGAGSDTTVLLLSPLQGREYLDMYPDAGGRMIELPPGIDDGYKAPADGGQTRRDLRREFGIGDDELLILQIGSGFRIKGVDRSLRAVASLPGPLRERVRFFLIGSDDAASYRKLAGRLGLARRFRHFDGRDDIPRFLQGADLLLHPAHKESAGKVLLEAVVAGLPVLTTDTCGYALHVERAGAGRVCASPFNQRELDRHLAEMLAADDERETWRENGIRYGREHDLYSMPERVAEILLSDTTL